jgi:hypothetical protein
MILHIQILLKINWSQNVTDELRKLQPWES